MKIVLAVLLLAVGCNAFNFTTSPGWVNCGDSSDHAQNMKVAMSPGFTVHSGDAYTDTSSYTLDKTVTGGTAKYDVTLSGIPVFKQTNDLCDDLAESDTPCPIAAGDINSVSTGEVPSGIPHGMLESKTEWFDQDGERIFCLKFNFKIA
jgi:hypothetical protein